MPTLDAETVPTQIVMPTRGTHEPPRRIRLQPPLVLAPVPDSVLRPQHPSPSFAVQHREVAHRDAARTSLQDSVAPFLDPELVVGVCHGKWSDSHAERMQVVIMENQIGSRATSMRRTTSRTSR